ncbi:MAG: hypothetical protein ABIR54_00960 [Burkholderiaceae bacterium]
MLKIDSIKQQLAKRSLSHETESPSPWLRPLARMPISRRTLIAGAAGAAGSAAFSVGGVPRLMDISATADVFVLTMSNGARWSVDRRMFDGAPRLDWTTSEDRFSLTLSSATLPATNVRCDFTLHARRIRGSWYADLAFPALRAMGSVRLEDWVAGTDALLTSARLPDSAVKAVGFRAGFGGSASMRFDSDWNFTFVGTDVADLSMNGRASCCSEVTLAIRPGGDSALATGAGWRTLVNYVGVEASLLIAKPDDVVLVECPGPCHYQAEFSRAAGGGVQVASLWSSEGASGLLEMLTNEAEPHVMRVPIDRLRVAQLHNDEQPGGVLFAGVSKGRHWQEIGSMSVLLVAEAQAMITVATGSGQGDAARLENTRVVSFVVPFVGADSATFHHRATVASPSTSPGRTGVDVEMKDDFSFRTDVIGLDDFDLVVSRMLDGFAGTFRFRGLELRSRRGQWFLSLARGVRESLLEFELASQHLQEEVVYSASPPGGSDIGKETFCAPFSAPDLRILALIVKLAKAAWVAPSTPDHLAVRALLKRFMTAMQQVLQDRQKEQKEPEDPVRDDPDLLLLTKVLADGPGHDLPGAVYKFLTPGYVDMLKASDPPDFLSLAATADSLYPDKDVIDTAFHSVDAKPTRLVFEVRFPPGEDEVAFDLACIVGWSTATEDRKKKVLEFIERLSTRSLATDADVEAQQTAEAKASEPVPSVADGASSRAATSIQLPYRLEISPLHPASGEKVPVVRWLADTDDDVASWGGVKSLWHLRLGDSSTGPTPFRALYSPDFDPARFFNPPPPYPSNTANESFRTSLDAHDRHNIVALSAGFGRKALMGSGAVIAVDPPAPGGASPEIGLFVPLPFHATRMVLTPLGASFDLLGNWSPPGSADGALTVMRWEHRARIRRDTAVTIEYKGYLMPLGMPAVLIKRTVREFKRRASGSYRAVLVQRVSIRVDPRPKTYPAHDQSYESRDWCFSSVSVETGETPPLLPPGEQAEGKISCSGLSRGRQAFWPMIPVGSRSQTCTTGKLFEFAIRAGATEFMAPLVFVDNDVAHTPSMLMDVLEGYGNEVQSLRARFESNPSDDYLTATKALARVVKGEVEYLPGSASRNSRHLTPCFVLGVRVAAPRGGAAHVQDPILQEFKAAGLIFNAEREKRNQPPFYPRISEAILESKLIAGLTGSASARFAVEFHPTFVRDAFDATSNAGAVFLRFVGAGARMDVGKDTSTLGGAMASTTEFCAVARDHGPIGGNGRYTPPLAAAICAAPMGPAAVGVRPQARGLARPAPATTSSDGTDPVAKFMRGISDPMEYFGNVLGDAKLLGCVRLVDIVKTAMQLTGTKVPRIAQEEVFDGVIDLIRPLVLGVGDGTLSALTGFRDTLEKDPNAPAAARARLTPSLNGAIEALQAARAELQSADARGSFVAAQATAAAGHLRRFADDSRALAEDPASLLPPMAQQVIAEAKALLNGLDRLRHLVDSIPARFRDALLADFRARTNALKVSIEQTLQGKLDAAEAAAYAAVAEWIAQLSDGLDAMERALTQSALQAATTTLGTIADRVEEFRGWIALAQSAAQSAEHELIRTFIKGCAQVRQTLKSHAQVAITLIDTAGAQLESIQGEIQKPSTASAVALMAPKAPGDPAPELELLRTIVQAREQLSAVQVFLREVEKEPGSDLAQVKQVLDAVQKLQGLVRKTVEFIKACRLAGLASAATGLYVRRIADAILELAVDQAFDALARLLEGVAVGDTVLAIRSQAIQVIRNAATVLRKLRDAGAALEEAFLAAELQVIEEAYRQLAILLSCLLSSPVLIDAARSWQRALEAAQSKLDEVGDQLCGLIGAVPVLSAAQGRLLSRPLLDQLTALRVTMLKLVDQCRPAGAPALRSIQSVASLFIGIAVFAQQLREIVSTVATAVQGGNVGMLVDVRKTVDELIAGLGLPTRLRITYDWNTDIEEFPRGGSAVFRPVRGKGSGLGGQPRLGVSSLTEIDLRNGGTPVTTVNGYVDAFDLHLFGSASFLIVGIDPVRFTSGSGLPLKLDVRVNAVAFGQALKFVDDLAHYLAGDSGLYVKPSFRPGGIEVGYRFNKDIVQLAAVTLQNVSMSVAVLLPFDNSPMRLHLAVGSRQNPVLASVGIYGGGFYVAMTMRADTMELLEFAMEYGLVTGVNFGPLTGTAKITAGIYISLGARDEIGGYFNASGSMSVAHLLTVGAALVVSLTKQGGDMRGDATYTFEFSLGIIDYSYEVDVTYAKEGHSDMNTSAGETSPTSDAQPSSAVQAQAAPAAANDRLADYAVATEPAPAEPATTAKQADRRALYTMAIVDKVQEPGPGRRRRPARGLADAAVWNAYWAAFSDLDGADTPMCNLEKKPHAAPH